MGLFDKLLGKSGGDSGPVDPNCIYAPMEGRTIPVSEVPDPVFADGILGEGVAILPTNGKIFAPCNATVDTMCETGHAINLIADNGAEILIHVGLETVGLGGKCFKLHVKDGDKVKKGQLMFEADLEGIKAAGLNTVTPVLVCNADEFSGMEQVIGQDVTNSDAVIKLNKG